MTRFRFTILLLFACCLLQCPKTMAQQDSAATAGYEEQDYSPETYEEEEEVYTDEYQEEENFRKPDFSRITLPPDQKERKIDEQKWKQVTSDKAFTYTEEKPELKPRQSSGTWARIIMGIVEFFTSTAGRVLIWVLVAGLLLLLILNVLKLKGNILFSRKDKKFGTATDETDDDYVPANWELTIQEAAQAGNYRLAVRHGYRYLLFLLQERELIQFQTAKTNYQYAFELAGSDWHKPFMQLTREYEYAWYGGFAIEKEQFDRYYAMVSNLKSKLK